MNKIKILDGAMGSELIRRGEVLPPHIWSSEINLTNPDLVYEIHKNYIEKGADHITTNTFRTTPRAYKKIGLTHTESFYRAQESFDSAINMAKKASNGKIKILGSIAPLEDCYSPELFPGEKIANEEFEEIGRMFHNSSIDCLILETMNSIVETRTCLEAIEKFNIPIWVSFNLLNSTQIRSGEPLEKAIKMIGKYAVDCLLLNCNPLERTMEALIIMNTFWPKKWGIYPNIGKGEPSPDGVISDYYSDKEFLKAVDRSASMGAHIIGGCCGSSPKHISLIKRHLN